ncbi:hypothetical protein [Humidesulfovibrio sp.]
MYASIEEAKIEVWQRWNNIKLRRRVEEYLDGDIPPIFRKEPKGLLARFIATPNFEFCNFARLASTLNISPVASEFRSDKFYSINPDKKHLGKINIYRGDDPFSCLKRAEVKEYKILNFFKSEGIKIEHLDTVWGQNLILFHQQLTKKLLKDLETHDLSDWFARHGGHPDAFYPRLLALFVCHGVQFENYHLQGREAKFTQEVVVPAFKTVTEHFGIQPLIVPVVPITRELDPAWSWYPSAVEADIQRNMPHHDTKTKLSS